MNRNIYSVITASAVLFACGGPEGLEAEDQIDFEQTDSAIQDGNNVPDGHVLLDTVVAVFSPSGSCTGTIIGKRHILTAAHCKPRAGNRSWVAFYNGIGEDPGDGAWVTEVWERSGVDDVADDLYDAQDDYADIAVLKLDRDIPSYTRPAVLPYWRQAEGTRVLQIGRGRHDDNNNPDNRLRYAYNSIRYYQDGTVNTEQERVNSGDSGGPLYTNFSSAPVVHGALWGYYWDFGGAGYRDRYTSTYHHSHDLLEAMGHSIANNTDRPGNDYEVWSGGPRLHCSIQCMQDSRCSAYTWVPASGSNPSRCYLKSASGPAVASTGMVSGRKLSTSCTPDSMGICRM